QRIAILAQSLLDRGAERLETRRDVGAQMDAERAAASLGEDRKIPARLRGLDDAERVFLPGHGHILRVITGNLQEDAAVGATLVPLAGGVQEPRAEAEARRDALAVADPVTDLR